MKRTRITNDRFSIRLCRVAEVYGFTYILDFYRFLKRIDPNVRFYCNGYLASPVALLKEIEQFKTDNHGI